MTCYCCGNTINSENASVEHIIPNSIGGKLKSTSLLCKTCNNGFGNTIDADFGNQYGNLVAFLGINRDRQKEYIIKNVKTQNGELYHLVDGRNPLKVKPTITFEDSNILINARDKKQLKQIIQGLKRKHPALNEKELHINYLESKQLLDETFTVDISVGGQDFLKAVGKIAVNTYLHFGGDVQYLGSILNVIKGSLSNDRHIHLHDIPMDLEWVGEEVIHLIKIFGNKENRTLYAYLILFSSHAFIVNLNDNYSGDNVDFSFSYDILEESEKEKNINISYPGRHLYLSRVMQFEKEVNNELIISLQKNISRVIAIAEVRQCRKTLKEMLADKEKEFINQLPKGTELTIELFKDFEKFVNPEVERLFAHWNRPNNINKNVTL